MRQSSCHTVRTPCALVGAARPGRATRARLVVEADAARLTAPDQLVGKVDGNFIVRHPRGVGGLPGPVVALVLHASTLNLYLKFVGVQDWVGASLGNHLAGEGDEHVTVSG